MKKKKDDIELCVRVIPYLIPIMFIVIFIVGLGFLLAPFIMKMSDNVIGITLVGGYTIAFLLMGVMFLYERIETSSHQKDICRLSVKTIMVFIDYGNNIKAISDNAYDVVATYQILWSALYDLKATQCLKDDDYFKRFDDFEQEISKAYEEGDKVKIKTIMEKLSVELQSLVNVIETQFDKSKTAKVD